MIRMEEKKTKYYEYEVYPDGTFKNGDPGSVETERCFRYSTYPDERQFLCMGDEIKNGIVKGKTVYFTCRNELIEYMLEYMERHYDFEAEEGRD